MNEEKNPTEEQNQAEPSEETQTVVAFDGESETATEEPEKKQTLPDEIQEKIDKKINRLVFEKHEANRILEEERRKNEELIRKQEQQAHKVEIPAAPELFDEEDSKKLSAREDAIRKDAQRIAYEQFQAEAKQREFTEAITRDHKAMYDRSAAMGVSKEELENSERVVGAFLKHNPEVAHYIVKHEKSPLIVKQLAGSVEELVNISKMSPTDAVGYIASTTAKKAELLKPAVTKTPNPLDIPSGKGAGEKVSPYLDGVQWE